MMEAGVDDWLRDVGRWRADGHDWWRRCLWRMHGGMRWVKMNQVKEVEASSICVVYLVPKRGDSLALQCARLVIM